MVGLSRRALAVLRFLAEAEKADDDFIAEIVREDGKAPWLGMERLSMRTLDALIRCCAISDTGNPGFERWRLNSVGHAIGRRPELAEEVLGAVLAGKRVVIGPGDRIMALLPR